MRRHELDPPALVFGSMFVVFGALFLFTEMSPADLELAWIWPLAVIGIGLMMLLGGLGRRDRGEITTMEPGAEEEEPLAEGPVEMDEDAASHDRRDTDAMAAGPNETDEIDERS